MALGFAEYRLTIDFRDNGNKSSTRQYRVRPLDESEDYNDVLTAVQASIIPTIAATSDSAIASWQLGTVFEDGSYTIPASSGVQNENQAIITVALDGLPLESGTLTIPAAKTGVFLATSGRNANIVNTAASIVSTFINLFIDGGWLTLSDGEIALASGAFGKRRHTKNTNG